MSNRTYQIEGQTYKMPEMLYDIEDQAIATDFEPTDAKYVRNGFMVKPDTAGTLNVITFKQYVVNGNSISGLTAVSMYQQQYEWLMTPVVAVYATSDAANINIGLLN